MTLSYNGWPASTDASRIDIVPLEVTVRGQTFRFPGGCKGGDVHTIFTHFLPRFHVRVESLADGGADEWGYAYRKNRNADNYSCHASGTAVDVNSERHPNGDKRTFTATQVKALRTLLSVYEGVLKWGGDFHGTTDEMHFEINGGPADVARIARKIAAKPTTPTKGDELTADDLKKIDALIKKHVDAAVTQLNHDHKIMLHGDEYHPNSLDSIAKATGVK